MSPSGPPRLSYDCDRRSQCFTHDEIFIAAPLRIDCNERLGNFHDSHAGGSDRSRSEMLILSARGTLLPTNTLSRILVRCSDDNATLPPPAGCPSACWGCRGDWT